MTDNAIVKTMHKKLEKSVRSLKKTGSISSIKNWLQLLVKKRIDKKNGQHFKMIYNTIEHRVMDDLNSVTFFDFFLNKLDTMSNDCLIRHSVTLTGNGGTIEKRSRLVNGKLSKHSEIVHEFGGGKSLEDMFRRIENDWYEYNKPGKNND